MGEGGAWDVVSKEIKGKTKKETKLCFIMDHLPKYVCHHSC